MLLNEFFNPSEQVIKAVSDLQRYYFLTNQDKMESFMKHGNKTSFKGYMKEYMAAKEVEELMSLKVSPWKTLIATIFLLKHFEEEIDTAIFEKLSDEDALLFSTSMRDGIKAKAFLEEWLKPLKTNANVLEAIKDANDVEIGGLFHILKLKELDIVPAPGLDLYPFVLEISSPSEMAMFLKSQKRLNNCLIVTIHRNEKRDWKSVFYMFLFYEGVLYSIDNNDGRLNQDNTAGDRNPDRWLERSYAHTWLPVDIIFDKNISKSKSLMLPGAKIYKLKSFEDIFKTTPEVVYWLTIFLFRCIKHIKENKIEIGVLPEDMPKLLTHTKDSDYKRDREWSGAGAYLLEIYQSQCKDIVVKQDHLPMIIGTEEFIRGVIAYKKRDLQAKAIQPVIEKDYEKNHERVYKEIRDFVLKYPIMDMVKRSFENKDYSIMKFPRFGHDEPREIKIIHESVLSIQKSYWPHRSRDTGNEIYLVESTGWRKPIFCVACQKTICKKGICLEFWDYRQYCDFFNLKDTDIPIEMKQHLHQQLEMYVGNSILDDTDPIDGLRDPWFRDTENRMGGPILKIKFPMCNRCIKKYDKSGNKKVDKSSVRIRLQ